MKFIKSKKKLLTTEGIMAQNQNIMHNSKFLRKIGIKMAYIKFNLRTKFIQEVPKTLEKDIWDI